MKVGFLIMALIVSAGAFAQTPPTTQKGPMQTKGAPGQVSDAALKKLEAAYTTAKASYAKKPKDSKVTKSFVDAAYAVGMGRMYSNLPPRQKYSGALDAFREVLKINPKHKGAKDSYEMIANIYKQMGRPVPGEK
jgi:tetratricopeptide (TPR) repeat protein